MARQGGRTWAGGVLLLGEYVGDRTVLVNGQVTGLAFPTAQNDQSGSQLPLIDWAMDMADDDELGQVSTIRRVSPVPLEVPLLILEEPPIVLPGEDAIEPAGDRPRQETEGSEKGPALESGFPDLRAPDRCPWTRRTRRP